MDLKSVHQILLDYKPTVTKRIGESNLNAINIFPNLVAFITEVIQRAKKV
jgi:hypothetical protein